MQTLWDDGSSPTGKGKNMDYQKNITRKSMATRFIACIIIAALASGTIGAVIGRHTGKGQEVATVYGAYDDKEFKDEAPLDWKPDGSFKPLDIPLDTELQEFTYYLCSAYHMDHCLIFSIMKTESDFRTAAVSKTNDYGLMQINECNFEWITEAIGVTDYLDPYQNIRAGCFVLRKLFEKYQKPDMVLMAYNMGEKGARRLWQQGIYSTDYTDKVLKRQKELEKGEKHNG